ncbi:MAG TPA: hypothetical protein VG498_09175 [Terriglobales bacterium]|nr:hypothetical protein [Terriglobales bacterium]
MNNEVQVNATAVLANAPHGASSWDGSDYAEEDCGCRGQWRGHSLEFLQILRVLAQR